MTAAGLGRADGDVLERDDVRSRGGGFVHVDDACFARLARARQTRLGLLERLRVLRLDARVHRAEQLAEPVRVARELV